MTINTHKSPWGDGEGIYILVTNGKEIFRARVHSCSNLFEDKFVHVEWGYLLAASDRRSFKGKFENVTGRFIEVSLPKKIEHESPEEVSKWRVIRGTIKDYRSVGTRVRIYSVLRTVDGIITGLVPDISQTVTVQYPGRTSEYDLEIISFLIN